jgi:hypothetical protein
VATYTLTPITTTINGVEVTAGGNESTISVGDPVTVIGCTDNQFNMDQPSGVVDHLGPGALPGTLLHGLTVVIPWQATPNATSDGCQLSQGQGWPNYLTITHASDFLGPTTAYDVTSSAAGKTAPFTLARNVTITNSIFSNTLGLGNNIGEGTRTIRIAWDTNTFVLHHNIFEMRDVASCPGWTYKPSGGIENCYAAYDDNHNLITPPQTVLWGTSTIFCPTTDPTSGNCVGVLGMMGMPSAPLALSNWNDYRLCHASDAGCQFKASRFAAGGPFSAADGTDMGFDPSQVNAAQISTQYCASCGSFPDHP